jgi:CubicO group peptidase (beta-lactamase class C family)
MRLRAWIGSRAGGSPPAVRAIVWIVIWAIACLPGYAAAGVPEDLDALASACMATGATPGMAIAVVQGPNVIWERGLGDADREAGRKVTPETAFYIASTTKALTALAALRVAARGGLDLDAPLSRALPGARAPAGVALDSIRVRDLLTHTHGIDHEGPITLRVAFSGDYTNELLLELLGSHRAAKSGRAFRYSNLGYDLTGILLSPSKTGGWKEVVDREVLRPLGMTATTANRSAVAGETLAQPYEMGPAGFERVRLAKEDANMGPAGGHFSTARDLARLLQAELNGGRVPGAAGIPAEIIAATQNQQVAQSRTFGPYVRHGWSFGWDLGTYEGDTLIHRFGSFAGYRSHVSFMPRRGIGVVVLVNGGDASSGMADVVATAIYDRLLGRADAEPRLRNGLAAWERERDEAIAAIAADRAKRAGRSQALPRSLDDYTGKFVSPEMGTMELRLADDGRLEARLGVARSRVEVFDAAKNQLRVELLGSGSVVTVNFAPDAARASEVAFLGRTFRRE